MFKPKLLKKIIRSMWSQKTSYISCIFVISIGIICYCTLSSTCDSLQYSVDTYYKETRFADIFARVDGFPYSQLSELTAIPGIADVEGRISENSRLITSDRDVIVTLKLIGLDVPAQGASPPLNMYYQLGTDIINDSDILIGNELAEARDISQGDSLELALYGQVSVFNAVGAVQSPEYVYTMPEDGSLFPDPSTFGIAFVKRSTLERITGRDGVVTDLAFALSPGFAFDDVEGALEDKLSPYGLETLCDRDLQPSNMMVKQEFESIDAMSGSMAGLFMMIAAIILYIMLRRLVEHERTQIGTLKAFGYTNGEIIAAYSLYGIITGLVGGMVGALLSIPLSGQYYALFSEYFNIPKVDTQTKYDYLLTGVFIAVLSGGVAALVGVRSVMRLKPADAMRPSAPAYITGSLIDRVPFLPALLTKRGMMALRFIGRNKLKSAMIVFSIAMSFALMTVGYSFDGLIDAMMADQFTKVQVYDIKTVLKGMTLRDRALSDFLAIDGVSEAEAIIELPVTVENENRNRTLMITGLNPGSDKYRIINEAGVVYTPPVDGLIMTQNYADSLELERGDAVLIKSPLLPAEGRPLRVVDIIGSTIGAGCYMDAEALSAFLRQPALTNSVVLRVDDGWSTRVKELLTQGKNISSVNDINRIVRNYEETMGAYTYLIYIILIMAILIAFAVIYNISGISLAERQRELATMRVLGMTPGETAEVLTFEHWVLFSLSVLIGIPITIAMRYGLAANFKNELYSFPIYTPIPAFIYSALSCAISVLLANIMARRSIGGFSLVEVLKERE